MEEPNKNGHTDPPAEKLDAEVKARIRAEHKRALQRIARRRDMDLSDVLREIIRTYLDNVPEKEPANV